MIIFFVIFFQLAHNKFHTMKVFNAFLNCITEIGLFQNYGMYLDSLFKICFVWTVFDYLKIK